MLSEVSGVPVGWMSLTVGCMFLGWGLNVVWGYKILNMARKRDINGKKQSSTMCHVSLDYLK